MKITKIPGLGQYGIYIDDIDFNNLNDEEWKEVGKLHLKYLVTIIRNVNISNVRQLETTINKWGPSRFINSLLLYEKYKKPVNQLMSDMLSGNIENDDKQTMINARNWQVDRKSTALRVTPKIHRSGQKAGLFGDGELKWHSNECGDILFTPGVSLLGRESMTTSCTGFLVTPDWYEEQTETFKSELNEIVTIYNYKPKMIDTSDEYIKSYEDFYKMNMCPTTDSRIPLVIKSPGGIIGIHLGINTFDRFEGMTKQESDKLYKKITDSLFVKKYSYEHWYQQDNDLCIFDNSITLHNRKIKNEGTAPERLAWRIQHDYEYLTGQRYHPYFQKQFNDLREERLNLLIEINKNTINPMI